MSKEIIINASKDRSRIAIVEQGELVELYVENPDNVRTIGNIYLGRIRKIMPAIRAAFVDIGQQQDAFLHFSDLTDNLPELLSIAAGDIPDARSLMKVPKRVKEDPDDDTSTADLEVESEQERRARHRREQTKRSRRGRRGGRRRGRRRGNDRSEEEEQEEQTPRARRSSPYVIDLTSQPAKQSRRPKPDASRDTKQSDAEQSDAEQSEAEQSEARQATKGEASSKEQDASKTQRSSSRERSRRSSSRRPSGPRRRSQRRRSESDQAQSDAGTSQDAAKTPPRQQPPSQQKAQEPASKAKTSDDAGSGDEKQGKSQPESKDQGGEGRPKGRRSRRRGRRSQRSRSQEQQGDQQKQPRDDQPQGKQSKQDDSSKRGGRGARRGGGRRGSSSRGSKSSSSRSSKSAKSSGSKSDSNGDKGIAMVASSKRAEDYLKRDQNILVKIIKEPISNKGSRISTDISLAGRFLVLVPMADYVAVSKKVASSKERRRLRSLAGSLRPEGFGIIVRTVAAGRDAKALDTDLSLLIDKWRSIEKQLRDKVKPPVVLYEDVNMVSSIIRDLFTDDFDRILIDDPRLYRNVKSYIEAVAPQMAENVQLYKGRQGVFRSAGIERSVEEAFSPRVNMKSGGYLFIEHTEAMHVVDVNSGRAGRGKSQAQNLLDVNLEAAKEIAKQLRLRDLGGIICVDFIDMRLDSHRKKLYDTLKQEFRKDRAVTKLLPMSDFGVVQITRQRLRPSITAGDSNGDTSQEAAGAAEIVQSDRTRREIERLAEDDSVQVVDESRAADESAEPAAAPSGQPKDDTPSRTAAEVVAHLEAWLQHYRDNVGEKHKHRPIVVRVHPFTAAFLRRGIPSTLLRWRMRMRQPRFEVDVTDEVNPLSFEVRDKKSGKDLTKKYTVAQ